MVELARLNASEQANRLPGIIVGKLMPILIGPDNWDWEATEHWQEASRSWRDFNNKWYRPLDSQNLPSVAIQDPSSDVPQFLSLEPLDPTQLPFNNSSSTILVRKSYVEMFDRVWARVMSSQGKTGVIITGQPGTGAHLLSHFPYYE